MTLLIVVMALGALAGLAPLYVVNVAGRRDRWKRYVTAFPDATHDKDLLWYGGFDGLVGSIKMYWRGRMSWFDLAIGEDALHIRNIASLFPSINRLTPISIPWEALQSCAISKGNALTGSTLTFCFSGRVSDALQAEDLGFQNQFKVAVEFGGILKSDRSDFETLTRRLGEMGATKDRLTST